MSLQYPTDIGYWAMGMSNVTWNVKSSVVKDIGSWSELNQAKSSVQLQRLKNVFSFVERWTGQVKIKTLPEAQWTQAIESVIWVIFTAAWKLIILLSDIYLKLDMYSETYSYHHIYDVFLSRSRWCRLSLNLGANENLVFNFFLFQFCLAWSPATPLALVPN